MAVILVAVTYSVSQWLPGVSPGILIVIALVASTALNLILQLRFALAAIVAIYHDVLITVSFLSLFNVEFDLQILAALLTITGYSLYDTIVVFDRIRENIRGRRRENFPVIVNNSINETLSRTYSPQGTPCSFCWPSISWAARCCTVLLLRCWLGCSRGRTRRSLSPALSWSTGTHWPLVYRPALCL